ncbi:uncharacterized protein LOC116920347 isoform X2 [Daphnia magna]|uniref:uncharacterized protein LOC116920347 isoform X2 n=1 Tax=Daphnia magna TaxID=35525 RepID=UPI001E1BD2A4|nr:uncharacterized protein LOC116920347 isoform X2 [Daphnia magna]
MGTVVIWSFWIFSCFVVWCFVVAARIRIVVFPGFAGVALSCTVRDAVSNWICCGDHLQTFPYGSGVTFTVGSERRVVFLSNCMLPDFRCSAGGVVDSVFRRVRSAAITSCHAVSLAVVVVCCGKLLSAYRHGAIMGNLFHAANALCSRIATWGSRRICNQEFTGAVAVEIGYVQHSWYAAWRGRRSIREWFGSRLTHGFKMSLNFCCDI